MTLQVKIESAYLSELGKSMMVFRFSPKNYHCHKEFSGKIPNKKADVDMSGSPCTEHSSMGRQAGKAGTTCSTVGALFAQHRARGTSVFIHENVGASTIKEIVQYLAGVEFEVRR